jgi:hypothetical protein
MRLAQRQFAAHASSIGTTPQQGSLPGGIEKDHSAEVDVDAGRANSAQHVDDGPVQLRAAETVNLTGDSDALYLRVVTAVLRDKQ